MLLSLRIQIVYSCGQPLGNLDRSLDHGCSFCVSLFLFQIIRVCGDTMRSVLVENDGELFVPDEFDDLIELINIMLKVFSRSRVR